MLTRKIGHNAHQIIALCKQEQEKRIIYKRQANNSTVDNVKNSIITPTLNDELAALMNDNIIHKTGVASF
jgi:hypothetical protein